ncbi:MAG: 50S ribosomal protein L21 [Clostridiaceae bacterium]|jgi:large subunit ribosomal protein L21|nr:50S ribosomal protein L21 [Clostridiaceae bacterium]
MYAVILTGGKQYKVSVDDEIFIEKLDTEAGQDIEFDRVLAIGDDSGIRAGQDAAKARVAGQIVKHGKNKKIDIVTYKAKKGYRRKAGHRQPYTKVRITAIHA